jgi:hypothetical protein
MPSAKGNAWKARRLGKRLGRPRDFFLALLLQLPPEQPGDHGAEERLRATPALSRDRCTPQDARDQRTSASAIRLRDQKRRSRTKRGRRPGGRSTELRLTLPTRGGSGSATKDAGPDRRFPRSCWASPRALGRQRGSGPTPHSLDRRDWRRRYNFRRAAERRRLLIVQAARLTSAPDVTGFANLAVGPTGRPLFLISGGEREV